MAGNATSPIIISSMNHQQSVPIISLDPNGTTLDGMQYIGFGVDLLDMIFERLDLSYKIEFAQDQTSGQLVDNLTGRWTGIIGQVVAKHADMAMAALSVDVQRSKYVDFSVPFKQLGIAILYVAPTTQPPSFYSIFKTLSWQIWLAIFTLLVIFCFSVFIFAKMEQRSSLSDSVWFCLAALLRQGFPPPSLGMSNSVTAVIWWLCTLILSTIFIANFTTYLALPIYDVPFNNFEDLVGQSKVKFGFHSTGSIGQYFKTSPVSLYREIWHKVLEMNKTEQVLLPSNDIGTRKVLRSGGNYAFLMDTPPLDSVVASHCELAQVGGMANTKYWAIVMQKGSPLRSHVNRELLHLMERGILVYLDRRWLYRGRKKLCNYKAEDAFQVLELSNVGGVFVLYGHMTLVAMLSFVLEFLLAIYVARRLYVVK